jgi:1,4-dihydroxy-2-naphthoate octaprenyltransferase
MRCEHTEPLTPKLAVGLAAPHTWGAASVCPAFLGTALAISKTGRVDIPIFYLLFVIVLLMHSAVNTLNDYFDFIKGTDTLANSDDPGDAILVYNRLDPRAVLRLGVSYLALAAVLGMYVVYRTGLIPLVIGLIGGLAIVGYSAGKSPISYLPIGELVSGFVMGGLIPLAMYASITGETDFWVLCRAIPMMIGIGLIMMTNNTCDIERDRPMGRRTLAVLLGRDIARRAYRRFVVLWLLALALVVFHEFPGGFFALPVMLLLCSGALRGLLCAPLTPEERGVAMGLIIRGNLAVDIIYLAAIALDGILI